MQRIKKKLNTTCGKIINLHIGDTNSLKTDVYLVSDPERNNHTFKCLSIIFFYKNRLEGQFIGLPAAQK